MRIIALAFVAAMLVGCGSGDPAVPDVTGLSEDGARRQLEEQDFRVNVEESEADANEGEVIAQEPKAGETLETEGARVTIHVAVPVTHTIAGTILLTGQARSPHTDAPCSGRGGYDDMREGAQVRVSDQSGEVIAVGRLDEGERVENDFGGTDCEFSFTVDDVPDAEVYTIEVSHRGGISYDRSEMEAQDWEVSLNLG